MASTAAGLVEWVKDHIVATVDGTGSYINDLTGDDVVVVTDGFPPPGSVNLPVQVFVYDEEFLDVTPGQPLTAWNQTLQVYIAAFVAGDGTSLGLRQAALDLGADLTRAFRANRTASTATILSTSSVHDVRFRSESIPGAAFGVKHHRALLGRVDIMYRGDQ